MRTSRMITLAILLALPLRLAAEDRRPVAVAPSAGTTPAAPSGQAQQRIGAIVISGNRQINDDAFWPVIEKYYGLAPDAPTLARLTGEIGDLAKEYGYPFADSVLVNDGSTGGIVEVSLDEGWIDAVRIEGYANQRAVQILSQLERRPAFGIEVERRLLLVSELPAVRFRGAQLEREGEQSVLVVRLSERHDYARIEADNYGTESYGPLRARLSYRGRAVFDPSDEVDLSLRVNPVDPQEFLYASASYETQITPSGTRARIGAALGDSLPGGQFEGSNLSGASTRGSIEISHPLVRTEDLKLDLEIDTSFLRISQDDLGTMLRDDTVVTASIGMFTQVNVSDSRVRARLRYIRGLDLLGATRLGDPLASRSDGDGVFSALEFWADAGIPIAEDLAAYVAVRGQLAGRPLLSSEEFALGGAYRVRGYDFREVAGDSGVHAHAELRYTVPRGTTPIDFLQFYGFVEAGEVWDIASSGSEGSLYSAGPGMRARIGRFDLELETGIPLGGSGEQTPDKDPEFNVRAGVNF